MALRAPGDELRNRKRVDILHELLDDEVIGDAEVRSVEAKFREGQIKTVHAERDLVPQLTEIGLLEAWAIPNNEGPFAFVNIFQFGQTPDALAPPGMQIRGRQLWDA